MAYYLHLLLLACSVEAFPLQDLMTSFPGFPDRPAFAVFSGFLDIPDSNGRSLHYVFVESQNSPETDPLLLWLNGGPGCSSMLGLFYEHGPYVFPELGYTLAANPYAWNLNASIIYLESPGGVGFSQYGSDSNLNSDDYITAHDNLQAILQWFSKFPEYTEHDFYVTGESYGGVYVPMLAYSILQYNSEAVSPINLVGMSVGNGVTIFNIDATVELVYLAWSHAFMPWSLKAKIDADCVPTNYESTACDADMYELNVLLTNINRYDMYRPCLNSPSGHHYAQWLGSGLPCTDDSGLTAYFNNATVQQAFHIPGNDDELPWSVCSNNLNYSQNSGGSLWTYPTLISAGLKILIYSGDTDTVCPFPQTRTWIADLDLTLLQDHTQWYLDDQVAGYYEVYNGLTFVSVKGVGHMVPQWAPAQAYQLITSFLFDKPL